MQELDELRDELAHSFKNRNPHLDGEDLTEATQRTLDRLVFMRFLEDKLIEPEAIVEKLGERGAAWADFIAASERMNKIYNGIIFKPHFIDRADFIVDERTFAGVRERLAHTNTVYNFNYIPIHVLGSIYERFLGKVIVATDKRARVEEKPEVRKAGGVYYTPEYIVRYIVEQTIGRLIEGKTPEEIASMRFADIACGSGSFLLGVYDELLRYHTAYYNEPKNRRKALKAGCIEIPDGSLRLSLNQRKDILLNNIYGVDLDAQAVEVAQLSLFLKLLEDETTASAKGFQLQFRETMLPSLDKNVIHGNSLIGWDIGGGLFSDEEERKLFPMDFEQSFPEVMRRGGFDAIVGNPPYVRPHNLSKDNKEYFWQHYRSFTHKSDLYCCFIEKATSLLKEEGMLSYIVSNGWLRLNSFQSLRRHVLDNYEVLQLVELPFKVFAEANVNADVFVFKKEWFSDREANNITILEGRFAEGKIQFQLLRVIPQKAFESTFENVFDTSISPVTEEIKNKMRRGENIGNVFDIRFGLKTGDDSRFLHSINGLHAEDRPLLRGEDVKRYFYEYKGEYVWYVPERMRRHRQTARPGERERFEQPKVLVKDTSTDFAGTYDDQNFYVKDVLIVTPKVDVPQMGDLRFLTALINSRALRFYYRTTFKTLHVQSGELGSLPLPPINFSDKADRARHDRMVNLVEQMLAAKRQLQTVRTDRDRNHYENKCAALDRQIDALVYELYELTPAEIAIVEESAL
ncbi:MAG TPA: TaqI-like C-terminal specificity domain-containing protein [Pyrinomonadaceae bacterium]